MKVKLINNIGIEYEFISMTRAGYFLGRSHGYISDLVRQGRTIATNIHGDEFKLIKL